jgi:hypothetical protein
MIVWSKGLGKQRLPLELVDATPRFTREYFAMEGVIEPVCWNYSVKLSPVDFLAFLSLMSNKTTVQFLAERGGILLPFVARLIRIIPGLVLKILVEKTLLIFRRKGQS